MAFFLDTNICIYALKGQHPAIGARLRRSSPASIKIPSIVKAELMFGALKSDQRDRVEDILDRFLFPLEIVPFDDRAASAYAEIRFDLQRRGKPIGPNDMIVAATVIANNGTLVSHNVREFRRIKHLPVENWTR